MSQIVRYLPNDEFDAAINAASPSAANPFATMADVGASDTLSEVMTNGNTTGANVLDHNIASGKIRQLGTGNIEEHVGASDTYTLSNDPVSGGFERGWIYMDSSQLFFGYGSFGGPNGTSVALYDDNVDAWFQVWHTGSNPIWITDQNIANHLPTNNNSNVVISGKGIGNGGGTYFNSVALGGSSYSIVASDTAHAENLRIMGGVARYNSAPALATDRDFTDVGFVNGRYVTGQTYTISNYSTLRTLDASSYTMENLIDFVLTAINDLQNTPQPILL
jgi:hypothetical protein